MWDKLGWLNWFWQFLCDGLSSLNPKGFYYSYAWSCYCGLCESTFFCTWLSTSKLCGFLFVFDRLYFTQCLTTFFSIDHLLRLYVRFLILFHSNLDEVLSINPSANVFSFLLIYAAFQYFTGIELSIFRRFGK